MADTYLDHGVYGTYAATPTWNTPQEGDGKATGTGSCALGSVVFTQGHTAGSVAVFGATVTPATSASADAAADNLATAINASTTAISATFSGGPTASQLRNVVWARGPAGGAPSGTCQIMTRVASALLNDSGNTSLTQASFNGTVPTLTQFSGGASGAWGYFINSANVWPQALAASTYGLLNNTFLVGAVNAGDTIHLRTKRSGSNITCQASGTSATMNVASGTASQPVIIRADDGTKWSGDSGVFTLFSSYTAEAVMRCSGGASNCTRSTWFVGTRLTATTRNFVIRQDYNYGRFFLILGGNSGFVNVEFQKGVTAHNQVTPQWSFSGSYDSNSYSVPAAPMLVAGCVFTSEVPNVGGHIMCRAYGGTKVDFIDCDFNTTADTVATSNSIVTGTTSAAGTVDLRFIGCRASGQVAGSGFGVPGLPSTKGASASIAKLVKIENCDFGNISLYSFSFLSNLAVDLAPNNASDARLAEDVGHRAVVTSTLPGRRYYYETVNYLAEWNPASTWPLLRAQLPEAYNGSEDRWVYRVVTAASPGFICRARPISVLRLTKFNTLASGTRTLTLELLADQNIDTGGSPLQKSEVVLLVRYTDVGGNARVEQSFNLHSDTDGNLASSTAGWTATQYDVNSVAHYYNKLKASLTTAYQIKTNTEVFIDVLIGRNSPTTDDWYFIDPEVDLA